MISTDKFQHAWLISKVMYELFKLSMGQFVTCTYVHIHNENLSVVTLQCYCKKTKCSTVNFKHEDVE